MADLLTSLENLRLAQYIGESWWFPFLESIHVVASTFVVGSILMVDLRLLGLAGSRYAISRITRDVLPWTWGAVALSVVAGSGMFISQATHYMTNRAFQIKLVLLVLAAINMLVFHFRTARHIEQWDIGPVTARAVKLGGACSLLLWIGIMLAGRWIGHLT